MKTKLSNGNPYASNKVGFGIYHFGQGGKDSNGISDSNTFVHDGYDREQCDYQESLNYMNVYSYRMDAYSYDHLRRIKSMGCVTWVFYCPYVKVEINGNIKFYLKAGWKEEIDKLVEGVKKAGLWDVIIGFQYDEPLLRLDVDTFEEFSSYMAKFGKRQLSIFSTYEIIEGTHPRAQDPEFGMKAHVITAKSCRFLTDVGFDVYSHADYDKFKKQSEELMNKIGRDDVYMWHVPCTWTVYNSPTVNEDFCIENINVLYRLLMESKHPGGLLCYTWRSWRTNEALDNLFDTENPKRWGRLEKRMIEIGHEIQNIKLDNLNLK